MDRLREGDGPDDGAADEDFGARDVAPDVESRDVLTDRLHRIGERLPMRPDPRIGTRFHRRVQITFRFDPAPEGLLGERHLGEGACFVRRRPHRPKHPHSLVVVTGAAQFETARNLGIGRLLCLRSHADKHHAQCADQFPESHRFEEYHLPVPRGSATEPHLRWRRALASIGTAHRMDTTNPTNPLVIAGRYRVIRALGEGGMGEVYEAENLRTKRRVAVKTMKPEVASRVEYARRFEREAQAAGQLRHPNIVDVLDLGDDPELGLLFIVQEFLSGGDLRKCLKTTGTLPPQNALATLLPIVDALATAHAAGIVHRDLKPDNIFLHETPQGVVPKLIDFGIAKFTGGADASRTATGALLGSPNYMSPEQARGDTSLDQRTDVWSMGVVFYEALSGRIPYDAATTNMLLAKIIFEEPISLASLAPSLPEDLAAAIQRAVTKDLDARWPTMRAFSDALSACRAWHGIDPAHAPRWVVNAAGITRDSRASMTPPEPPISEPMEASRASSGETSAQRSGMWHGEVAATNTRATWVRFGVGGALLSLVALAALAVFLTRPVPHRSGLPVTTVVTYRPVAPPQHLADRVVDPSPSVVSPATTPANPPADPIEEVRPTRVEEHPPASHARPLVHSRPPVRAHPPVDRPQIVAPPHPVPRPHETGANGSLIMQ